MIHDDTSLSEQLILIRECNRAIGSTDKRSVHIEGLLHRAFSIFLLDQDGRLLLQRRQAGKYHSGGLWANACCGHPRPGEATGVAANRRLQEELGITARLKYQFRVRYRTRVSPTMEENELAYIYFGRLDQRPSPNPAEIDEISFLNLQELRDFREGHPEQMAPWLRHYVDNHYDQLASSARRLP
ncbi:isopentenyl-diphosphate Delta-isomerase [Sphingomonas sp. DG1-23]|uniref:isopentenyl-diphosphate Delta-isomerase n=1 Tax=Sphingomonas sp. DG1-23 TaxID=3068316 RepID=UPI00273F68AF|nr:isopentenyl-diphosphate Delta-isomerase [Sphingomonas sp. DG1-23]MDP5279871.1 isopentenyl-diphosphate Delta-isomerase [Sphingomonas sp. DG1-23]